MGKEGKLREAGKVYEIQADCKLTLKGKPQDIPLGDFKAGDLLVVTIQKAREATK